jgi:NitT/TauT family transport system substrate-binding protein
MTTRVHAQTFRKTGLSLLAGTLLSVLFSQTAWAENTAVTIGISGWTGFAPLVLAKDAGLFAKNGLDVDIKMIPQKDRLLAIGSGAVQCAATTVETYIPWNLSGISIKQILQMDKSYGADGIVARNDITTIADLKGKTVGVDATGTTSYFGLAWILHKNGMTMKDIKVNTLSPDAAAQSFIAGQNDAAMTYEPYLSKVRADKKAGKILATTLDYPMVMDTLGCTSDWLAKNPAAAKAIVKSYYDALDMIKKEPNKSYAIMGKPEKQSAAEFAESASYLKWADAADNKKFFAGELQSFTKDAGDVMLKEGLVKKLPELDKLYDTSFVN